MTPPYGPSRKVLRDGEDGTCEARGVKLWVIDQPHNVQLTGLPDRVAVTVVAPDEPLPDGIEEVEFLVPAQASAEQLAAMRDMRSLRVVQTVSAGIEWILPSVPEGVALCSARGARDAAVAEWVLAVVLADAKRLAIFHQQQTRGEWRPIELGELDGRRALIVGYGSIGAAVEARLAPLGVAVERVARSARPGVHAADALATLLPSADVVIVLVPLMPQTRGLFGPELLAAMKPGALLVNAGRGPVVDTPALLEALRAGRVRAALDVTDPEPLPADHPLWHAPGALVTPHLAGDTREAERRAYGLVAAQVARYVRGEPLSNVVTRGY
jgi:phosphoglycerate dehydrogenase-like enzyme